jgi:hypothetical protein
MRSLVSINVEYNRISGVLPDALGGLTNLGGLFVDHNRLSGKSPPTVRVIDISSEPGVVPASVGALKLPYGCRAHVRLPVH